MEPFGLIMNLIQAFLWVGGALWFFFSYKKKIDKTFEVAEKVSDIEKNIDSINKYICDLSDFFQYNPTNKSLPNSLKDYKRYYRSNSPVKLTDKGNRLIKDTGFDKIFEEKGDFIVQTVKQKLNPYWNADDDLFFYFAEKKSIDAMKEMYEEGDSLLNPIRIFIFSHGLFEEENEIVTALGIYIRDKIIQKANRWERFEEINNANKTEKTD